MLGLVQRRHHIRLACFTICHWEPHLDLTTLYPTPHAEIHRSAATGLHPNYFLCFQRIGKSRRTGASVRRLFPSIPPSAHPSARAQGTDARRRPLKHRRTESPVPATFPIIRHEAGGMWPSVERCWFPRSGATSSSRRLNGARKHVAANRLEMELHVRSIVHEPALSGQHELRRAASDRHRRMRHREACSRKASEPATPKLEVVEADVKAICGMANDIVQRHRSK